MIRDQHGMTLVELLVAFAISAIVLSGIAYLLFTSLKLAGRNNANVEVQSELQTASNLMLDSIMEAEGICMSVPQSGRNTSCILLGDMQMKTVGSLIICRYKGDAVIYEVMPSGKGELYLAEFPNESYPDEGDGYCILSSNAATEANAAQQAMDEALSYVDGLGADRIKWLLARNVVQWRVMPVSSYGRESIPVNGVMVDKDVFHDPFMIEITLRIAVDYGSGIAEASVVDKTAVRNRLNDIYVKDMTAPSAEMTAYERKR